MANTRVLGTRRRNAVRCRNRTKSPKSDRTPPKAIPLNLRRKHDCVLAELSKSDTFGCILRQNPKSDRTPQNCPWHRIIQGVSANALCICKFQNHNLGDLDLDVT